MERFILSVKMANRTEAMIYIADYIMGFYSSVRLHSGHSAFEQQPAVKQSISVSEKT